VEPTCVNTIAEFESYVWAKDRAGNATDKPVKENDHAMDALRYMVRSLDKLVRVAVNLEMDMALYKPERKRRFG
jgi:phage terminase large subunit